MGHFSNIMTSCQIVIDLPKTISIHYWFVFNFSSFKMCHSAALLCIPSCDMINKDLKSTLMDVSVSVSL